jgi:DNA-binding NtrC family response regulator
MTMIARQTPILVVAAAGQWRNLLAQAVTQMGHEVLVASSLVEALHSDRQRPIAVAVLDTDLSVEEWDLLDRMMEQQKSPVLVLDRRTASASAIEERPGVSRLPKPFTFRVLRALLAQRLADSQPSSEQYALAS